MSKINRPHLQEPLTTSEIDSLLSRTRLRAVILVTATFVLSTCGLTQLGNPFLSALLTALGVIANCIAWQFACDMWKEYSDLPMEYCASANYLFSQARELEAYRQTILQMGRQFVWADYWIASTFKSNLFLWEANELRQNLQSDECKKLYGI